MKLICLDIKRYRSKEKRFDNERESGIVGQRNKNSNLILFYMIDTHYRKMEFRPPKEPQKPRNMNRMIVGAAIAIGAYGVATYIPVNRELERAKEKVEMIREGASAVASEREEVRKVGARIQRDFETTLGFAALSGMHRSCTRYDSKVLQRLGFDIDAINRVIQIRRDLREVEIGLRQIADQIEMREVAPLQRELGNSMIYIGLAGLVACGNQIRRKIREGELDHQ